VHHHLIPHLPCPVDRGLPRKVSSLKIATVGKHPEKTFGIALLVIHRGAMQERVAFVVSCAVGAATQRARVISRSVDLLP